MTSKAAKEESALVGIFLNEQIIGMSRILSIITTKDL